MSRFASTPEHELHEYQPSNLVVMPSTSNAYLRREDLLAEGFKPLRKAYSEPVHGLMKDAFTSVSGESPSNADFLKIWADKDPFLPLTKKGSFGHKSIMDRAHERAMAEATVDAVTASVQDSLTPSGDRRSTPAVAVVDPFSSGALLAAAVVRRGYHCVRVLSEANSPVAGLVQEGLSTQYDATVQHDDGAVDQAAAIEDTVSALRKMPWKVVAVLAGAETGVLLTDKISNRLKDFTKGLLTNGEELSTARRNKYVMGETIRKAGVRAVKQSIENDWEGVDKFLDVWNPSPFKVIVKPNQSAGSDDVFLCYTKAEVKAGFDKINGAINGLGVRNEGVLIQEFLEGKEYVVDSVSRDGVHKVMAIWEYDKRHVNDQFNVYFGMKLMCVDSSLMQSLVDYQQSVLNAVGIKHGPAHAEVMITATGPCLVEVGSRCHGGEGTWQVLSNACIGYNQIDVTLDAYLEESRFFALPAVPTTMMKSGREAFVVARTSGMLRATPGFEVIRTFPSYLRQEIMVRPPCFMPRTVDCFTRPAAFQLLHDDESVVQEDYERIRKLEMNGMFDFSVVCKTKPETGAVVIVDPFSSGALLAAKVVALGFHLVMLFSEIDSPVASLVAKGTSLSGKMVQHNGNNPDGKEALDETIEKLKDLPYPILAILAGAETGVLLADQLADKFQTRTNPLHLSVARRNKYVMGETIRKAGVRAVKQTIETGWEGVEKFLTEWNPSPFKVIVKPNQSAGSDDVFLCLSVAEVKAGFDKINGAINGLGVRNEGVLIQEFLEGTEYVVDSVSRDGAHKVTAIWEYDKRSINGQFNVYFGMKLLDVSTDLSRQLVAYQKDILNVLEINNGPAHAEIKMTATGPCLVEVGSRCHGGEGTWQGISNACVGYNQIDVTLDAYVRPDEFDKIPAVCTSLKNFGREVFLVAQQDGEITSIPGIDKIRKLPSFLQCEMCVQPGDRLSKTVDCFTRPGAIQLIHIDDGVVQSDYDTVRSLEVDGLFVLA